MRPRVRKIGGCWSVLSDRYGFDPAFDATEHASWRAALKSLESAPASQMPVTQLGNHTLPSVNQRGTQQRGTIRAEL